MRSTAILVSLLLTATVVVGAVISQALRVANHAWYDGDILLALGLAQVQLATAATVLVHRWLWLRLVVLTVCICFWSWVWGAESPSDWNFQAISALMVMGMAIWSALWSGAQVFLGWRLVGIGEPNNLAVKPGQFSLATLLLTSTLVGTYLGLWKLSGFVLEEMQDLLVLLLYCLAGGMALKAMFRPRWHWIPLVAMIAVSSIATIGCPASASICDYPLSSLTKILSVQLVCLGATALVLRIAGIRLIRIQAPPSIVTASSLPNENLQPMSLG